MVGKGGDELQIKEGRLFVNGQQLPLTNVSEEIEYTNMGALLSDSTATFVVPAQTFFVLGDNSKQSADSRLHGPVPAKDVVGRVVGKK
jgi:signal peptidase I